MTTPGLVIIADDLSGAADCAVVCVQAGLDTLVILGDLAQEPVADVLSVDGDTRGRSRAAAVAETTRLVRIHAPPGRLLFRKLDSTLRGHVGAEFAATLAVRREAGPAVAVMAPAFPATGRTTVGGQQLLHGAPLHETEIWRREVIPGRADIPEMLAAAGLRAGLIGLAQIRAPGLAGHMTAAAATHDALVCDAETEADLQAVAAASMILGRGTVWAGSAGLARYLPGAAGLVGALRVARVPAADGPILFVVGSLSAVSREQVARLAAAPGVAVLTVPPAILRAGPTDPGWSLQERALDSALATGQDVVMVLGVEGRADLAEGMLLARALARLASPHAGRIGALVSTGGETARAVLHAFGAVGLRLVDEVEPGVPLSITEGWRALPVVTKAGAFGTPETLLHCRAVLRAGLPPSSPSPESRA
jgi:uncharacterized protein YgbK (DUF1537 family)